ncbi:predicted protein [Streptomyces viridosporus ATCC 14672]|uniref:Predicted protein n=1 Tax=Streptomyces viridosporus (strain ATCC 14672 / DSM 40746 / JCM 4963 / KCTC 9882 / NRRL B-12104 / FH 1290) TaxID=566461 RepID=D6A778_STRV1|nr:predicted protein [Streptomyces viridosporus ATCC 14672]
MSRPLHAEFLQCVALLGGEFVTAGLGVGDPHSY